jgi:hypothetical protein
VAVDVFADLTNRIFVQSPKGMSPKSFARPFHQDKLYFSVQPLEAFPLGGQTSTPYAILDGAGFTLSVLVTKTDGTVLAGPATTWTPDEYAKVGSIDLNTAAMVTAFTSSSVLELPAYIYFQFDDGASRKTTLRADLTINRSYLTSGTPSELPLPSYLTREESIALFVRYFGNPNGSTITIPSPDGTKTTVIGTNDDGTFRTDPGT